MRVLTALLSLALCAVGAAPARAQDGTTEGVDAASPTTADSPAWGALVLSFGGDATEAMNAEARDGATAALLAQGFTVLAEAEVTARIAPSRLREATSIDPLRAIAAELGVESVVTVAVWTSGGAADSVIVSVAPAVSDAGAARSYSHNQSVGVGTLGEAARAAMLGALERRTRAAMLGGGSGHVARDTDGADEPEVTEVAPEDDPWAETPRGESSDFESLFGIIGPGLLLALGGAGIGLGVYALLDENCTQRGPSGVCLLGDAPNIGVGVLLLIGGVLAAGGAAAWWITGATAQPQARIEGVTLREGGMLRVTGSF